MWFPNWLKNLFTRKKQQNTTTFNPRPDCLKTIEDKPCVPDTYVCRHKCKDAYKCFKKHGYSVKVVRGPADGWEKEYHTWMESEYKGELYWYDPTWYKYDPVKYGWQKASLWTDRKAIKIEWSGVIKPIDDPSPPPERK